MGSSGGGGGGGGGGGINRTGAIIGGLGSIFQGVQTDINTTLANILNSGQRNWAMDLVNSVGPNSPAAQSQLDLNKQYIDWITHNSANAMSAYGDITNKFQQDATQALQGSGDQERKDINTAFDNRNAANQSDLVSRGLSATTLGSQMGSANERYRADALGGLNDRLRAQKLGVLNQGLSSGIGGINFGQQLFGRDLSQIMNLQGQPYQMAQDNVTRILNLLSGFNNFPPDQGLSASVSSGLGNLAVNPPSAPQTNLWGPSLAGAGIQTGGLLGGLGLMGAFGGGGAGAVSAFGPAFI